MTTYRRYRAYYRTIQGVKHKLCRGRVHPEGRFVPVVDFYVGRDREGGLRGRCKLCESRSRDGGWISTGTIMPFLTELINRVGTMETARRIGMTDSGMRYMKKRGRYVQLRVARSIMHELTKAREKNEKRHPDSIQHGSAMRGHRERELPEYSTDPRVRRGKDGKFVKKRRRKRKPAKRPSTSS